MMSLVGKMRSVLERFRGDGLGARAMRGTALNSLGFVAENVLRLGGNLVLTRILFPEAFGIMALIQVVISGLALFSDIGINASAVQDDRGEDPRFLNTLWTVQIARGFLLWAMVVALAVPVAAFYEEPLLASALPVAGLVAVFQGFNSTRMATAKRRLQYARLTGLRLGAQLLGLVVMIALALAWGSVWALVIGTLVPAAMVAILSHFVLDGHVNRLAFERDALVRLFRFGKYIFLSTIASFVLSQGDRAILGKLVTLDVLAFYNIGFFLASVPMLLMRRLSDSIFFPLYRERPPGSDPGSLRKLNRARILVTCGLLALSTFLALTGVVIVDVLYDPRYQAAGPLLVLIAIAFMPAIMQGPYGMAPLAAGHSGRFATIVVTIAFLRLIALLVLGYFFGIIGIAIAPAVASLAFYPLLVAMVRPYSVWTPRLDAGLHALVLAIALVAIWLNFDAIATLSF